MEKSSEPKIDDLELSKVLPDDDSNIKAQWYRTYCWIHKQWLMSAWTSDKQVAINKKKSHKRSYPTHTVEVRYK
ncbi:hypothetical protein BX611_3040 [Lutibacter oceani]|uniref:Uncharacterized protein n=1 Tax=Lutibacter oceani TaxID=1853311 RepID=A0A3D9RI03_9FLAO|nr:hypothetical protein [Lutibacter oceani]REE78709.1 hypothetical protein BX611_3040 [Lutibacter oceani]